MFFEGEAEKVLLYLFLQMGIYIKYLTFREGWDPASEACEGVYNFAKPPKSSYRQFVKSAGQARTALSYGK